MAIIIIAANIETEIDKASIEFMTSHIMNDAEIKLVLDCVHNKLNEPNLFLWEYEESKNINWINEVEREKT